MTGPKQTKCSNVTRPYFHAVSLHPGISLVCDQILKNRVQITFLYTCHTYTWKSSELSLRDLEVSKISHNLIRNLDLTSPLTEIKACQTRLEGPQIYTPREFTLPLLLQGIQGIGNLVFSLTS